MKIDGFEMGTMVNVRTSRSRPESPGWAQQMGDSAAYIFKVTLDLSPRVCPS